MSPLAAAAERAAGHPASTSWYNDRYIDGLAKGIFPMVSRYISEKRVMDQDFVKQAVVIYKNKFPDAQYDVERIFNRVVMLIDSDTLSSNAIKDALSKRFRVNSRSLYNKVDDPTAIAEVKKSSDTAMVIVSNKNIKLLKSLPSEWAAIAEAVRATSEKSKPALFCSEVSGGRSLLVVVANGTDEVIETFDKIKKLGKINPASVVQGF